MRDYRYLKTAALAGASIIALTSAAAADSFNIPAGTLENALNAYTQQSGRQLLYPNALVKGMRTRGVAGEMTAEVALSRILTGTGLSTQHEADATVIVRKPKKTSDATPVTHVADAAPVHAAASVETVVVTSSKIKGDIQTVPIAITALSQEQLTERQIAGGPDLVKEVPNLTFTKTNFTGYNLQIRGIGTQAVSVTTDPAVAVAFNDTPFLRNHFFEQEFFDVSQVQVLRGPQGTLFGRNANAGVVNIESAKPTDQFEAMLSADWGNYTNRRYEGMINIPIVPEKLALRVAGEWTKRDGYAYNEIDGKPIDGRDLWSGRATLRWTPTSDFTADLIWEHFQENDDRLRSGKQLCHTDPGPTSFTAADGVVVQLPDPRNTIYAASSANFSQGCLPGGLYDKGDPALGDYGAFGAPNGYSLPYVTALAFLDYTIGGKDPYAKDYQSTNLRNIELSVPPQYIAKSDTLEFNTEWHVTPALTFNSETGYNSDFLWSLEDFNRFETAGGIFTPTTEFGTTIIAANGNYDCSDGTYSIGAACAANNGGSDFPAGTYCDPQLGCSDRLVLEDLSTERSWQFSQEFRLASDFKGPFNFSAGGNYLHYETEDKFYVFSNAFNLINFNTLPSRCGATWMPSQAKDLHCLGGGGREYSHLFVGGLPSQYPAYSDLGPITNLNDNGHNYFLSKNPYVLNSYALFGEAYYNITRDLKLTGGLRWTDDEKHFPEYPSQALVTGHYGLQQFGAIDQSWKKFSGRAVINWTPKLDFTDQTMVYGSFSHGYKAGGANPPPAVLAANEGANFPVHPLTFKPEYINAFELGTKNTALDGAITFDGDVFYYDYTGYQISQLVDRTSVNFNVDATVRGAEIQADWSPLPGLKFGFNGGYEDTRIKNNQYFIDLMDRTYGHHDTWTIMKPWAGEASNCVLPDYVAAALVETYPGNGQGNPITQSCGTAYTQHQDPVPIGTYYPSWEPGSPGYNAAYTGTPCTNYNLQDYCGLVEGQPYYLRDINRSSCCGSDGQPYGYPVTLPGMVYPGFDPLAGTPGDPYTGQNIAGGINYGPAPNNGEGFQKPVGGNALPNAPHFTFSLTAQYTMPVSANWAATVHGDFYWQSQSWARIFNDNPYDKIRGYSNMNLALILNDASGWQVMGYVKNVFDTTAITGDFLYTDDVGLTTNIFETDPRLYGVRITKQFNGGSDDASGFDLFSSADGKRPQIWLTLGGNYNAMLAADNEVYNPDYIRPGGAAFNSSSGHSGHASAGTETMTQLMADSGFPAPSTYEKSPNAGFDWEGKLAFQPEGSDWVLKAGIRYGRSSRNAFTHESKVAGTRTKFKIGPKYHQCTELGTTASTGYQQCHSGNHRKFIDAHGNSSEQHIVMDFEAGVNVGIGLFGREGAGNVAAGVKLAQFDSRAGFDVNSDPEYFFAPAGGYHDVYEARGEEKRSFHGIGPEITWDANQPVLGNPTDGEVTIDWGVNAAILFGRQSANAQHFSSYCHVNGSLLFVQCNFTASRTKTISRSRRVTVPNLGGYAGLSVRYNAAKISFGYRADKFFNAMDGGQDTVKKYDRGFYGPYLNVSIGLGG